MKIDHRVIGLEQLRIDRSIVKTGRVRELLINSGKVSISPYLRIMLRDSCAYDFQ